MSHDPSEGEPPVPIKHQGDRRMYNAMFEAFENEEASPIEMLTCLLGLMQVVLKEVPTPEDMHLGYLTIVRGVAMLGQDLGINTTMMEIRKEPKK